MDAGKLYAIGAGPGAPDLLTIRAVKALAVVDVILAAASPANDYSIALEIVKPHLRQDARLKRLEFPMTRDKAVLKEAWVKAAHEAHAILRGGENAAFVTLGDPLVYSTFAYLRNELEKIDPKINVEIIPGITSFQAAAARIGISLCEGQKNLRIIPGIGGVETLQKELAGADTAVILKVYRNFPAIRAALSASGRAEDCFLASHVEQDGEKITKGVTAAQPMPPYMSLAISRSGQK